MDESALTPAPPSEIPGAVYQRGIVRMVTKALAEGVRPPMQVRICSDGWRRLMKHIAGPDAELVKLDMKTNFGPIEIVADPSLEPEDVVVGFRDPEADKAEAKQRAIRGMKALIEGKPVAPERGSPLRLVRG